MVEDFPPSQRPAWQVVGTEMLALTASGALFPFGLRKHHVTTPRKRDQRTVVLLHGYMANRSTMLPLATYLRWRGYSQILYFDYASAEGIERNALALKRFLKKNVRGGRVDLVCHSMGGLVARAYLQLLGGNRRVDRCITLSTPHQGTYMSYWIVSRVGKEMRPDSKVMKRLEETRQSAENVRMVSIVAGSDNIVVPRIHSAHEEVYVIPDLGHVGVLFSLNSARIVAQQLERAVAPNPKHH
ncbi:MAG: alpha/beta fold hydrolase [Myxococcales bacterium]|nr:alpha/beta fold hydrolase [Myxococcales bacterium]